MSDKITEPINHKGKPCIYKSMTCSEGFCESCEVPITYISCGLVDKNKVHLVDYHGESYPYRDETIGCIENGAKRIVE